MAWICAVRTLTTPGVKARAISRRSRVWSGGSLKTSQSASISKVEATSADCEERLMASANGEMRSAVRSGLRNAATTSA